VAATVDVAREDVIVDPVVLELDVLLAGVDVEVDVLESVDAGKSVVLD
jgi:hypothetical protein